jgi:uncharacterized protein YecE (DUF72 family)
MERGKQYYSGTSGLVLPVPNKLHYPEEFRNNSRLTYYASLFNSIEINSSFYKVPKPSTVEKWAANVPEDFKFTFKLYKEVTHQKGLLFDTKEIVRFVKTVSYVGAKRGCLLIQLPPAIKINYRKRLLILLTTLLECNEVGQWNLAIEFRDNSWYTEEIYEWLGNLGIAIVIQDMPKSATPSALEYQNIVYIRFHGVGGDYRGSYTPDFLRAYAIRICRWREEGKQVFLYFNNTIGGAVGDLMNLNRMIAQYCKEKGEAFASVWPGN